MNKLFGGILIAVGLLIAAVSGLCTLVVVSDVGIGTDWLSMMGAVLAFGGIPFAIGIGMIFAGRKAIRYTPPPADPDRPADG